MTNSQSFYDIPDILPFFITSSSSLTTRKPSAAHFSSSQEAIRASLLVYLHPLQLLEKRVDFVFRVKMALTFNPWNHFLVTPSPRATTSATAQPAKRRLTTAPAPISNAPWHYSASAMSAGGSARMRSTNGPVDVVRGI